MKAKKLLFMCICMVSFAIAAHAQKEGIAGVEFGTSRAAAAESFKNTFGQAAYESSDVIEFKNVSFEGQKFSQAVISFENNKFNQARFYIACAGKAQAVQKMNEIEKQMSKRYRLSADQEDDGTKFVKGGLGPDGQSLFTIYVFRDRKNGSRWTAGLRYGAFFMN